MKTIARIVTALVLIATLVGCNSPPETCTTQDHPAEIVGSWWITYPTPTEGWYTYAKTVTFQSTGDYVETTVKMLVGAQETVNSTSTGSWSGTYDPAARAGVLSVTVDGATSCRDVYSLGGGLLNYAGISYESAVRS